MNKKIIWGIIISILVIGGGFAYYYSRYIPAIDITHSELITKYSTLKDRAFSYKLVEDFTPMKFSSENICDGKSANTINYRTKTNENSMFTYRIGGDWEKIDVLDCGDNYWIYDYSDAGPKLFGPFDF